jgi:hypothetical protein
MARGDQRDQQTRATAENADVLAEERSDQAERVPRRRTQASKARVAQWLVRGWYLVQVTRQLVPSRQCRWCSYALEHLHRTHRRSLPCYALCMPACRD